MIKVLLVDLSFTLLFPVCESYQGKLNELYGALKYLSGLKFKFSDHFPVDETCKGKHSELYGFLRHLSDFEFKFSDHFRLDECLLRYLHRLEDRFGLYMFTSGIIQNAPEIRPRLDEVFRRIYSAKCIGSKEHPKSYEDIAKNIGVIPDELLFIDDSKKNIQAAEKAGIETTVYRGKEKLKEKIDQVSREQARHER